jgi:hypothetical protein
VPINPDYRAGEIAYLLDHSEADLVLTLAGRTHHITLALEQAGHRPPVAWRKTLTLRWSRLRAGPKEPSHGPRPARDPSQYSVYIRHDRAAEGLHPVAWL